uniref:Cell division protein FtsZ n=1 Tax=Corethron hystrix TaxID=216773 RepID=A0A7S1BB10_9STRA
MVASGLLPGVDFVALNTDAQHLTASLAPARLQIGKDTTDGLGCGADPEAGRRAAEESVDAIADAVAGAHMVFITAGMGGGTGTGAAPVVARACEEAGVLTVGVVTKPFRFEGNFRLKRAEAGVTDMSRHVDSMIVVPNQNLFHLVSESTSMMESFALADAVLLAGVRSITDLMVSPGLINLDFADVQAVMRNSGAAVLGTGEATGEDRAVRAAEAALTNPLLDGPGSRDAAGRVRQARGMLVNITGGNDMTLFEVDKAATKITEEVEDQDANIIFGSAYDDSLDGSVRVSVVATGIDAEERQKRGKEDPVLFASADVPGNDSVEEEEEAETDKEATEAAVEVKEELSSTSEPPEKKEGWWDRVRKLVD